MQSVQGLLKLILPVKTQRKRHTVFTIHYETY